MLSGLIEALEGRLQHQPRSELSIALDKTLKATRKADPNEF
jgi:hypothetical protein